MNGVNGLVFYSTQIFRTEDTLEGEKAARMGTLIMGLILPVFSCCGLYTVAKYTRRQVFITGNMGMGLCLFIFTFFLYMKMQSLLLLAIFGFWMVQTAFQGPLFFLYFSEILTPKAFSMALALNTFFLMLVSYSMPYLMSWNNVGTFVIFSSVNVLSGVMSILFMKETKGKSAKEIEQLYWP
jgi:hypothetical protein